MTRNSERPLAHLRGWLYPTSLMADFSNVPDLLDKYGTGYLLGGTLKLETKSRRTIENQLSIESPRNVLQARFDEYRKKYIGVRFRSITHTYNCVGMVFGSRRTQIDPKLAEWIMSEDGYDRVPPDRVEPGDLVVYRLDSGELTHVGIVVEKQAVGSVPVVKVLSKWGWDGPECVHDEREVPGTFGHAWEYYRERHHVVGGETVA